MKFRPAAAGFALIPICIGLNVTGHAIAVALSLPLFLDSIGTVLGAVLAGPWVGASIGLLTNFVSSNTVDAIAGPYAIVSVALGFAVGLVGYLDRERRLPDWIAVWVVAFLVASLLSTPLNVLLNGGRNGVVLGDAIYANLHSRFPQFLASFLAEAAIDVPDKLLAVLAALLIYRALPTQRIETTPLELDIGESLTFVFRSRRWLRRAAVAILCVAFSWLLVPLFLFLGYAVAIARAARDGDPDLPCWDRLPRKLLDGFLISMLFLIWSLPGLLLGLPAELASVNPSSGEGQYLLNGVLGALATLGGLWTLLVLVAQGSIWAQYLRGGFGAALDVGGVLHRVRYHAGLTIVVGALVIVLAVVALSGFALVVAGLLTLPYAVSVSAHLFGCYARLTDEAVVRGRPAQVPA